MKVCNKCCVALPSDAFYTRTNKCKECTKAEWLCKDCHWRQHGAVSSERAA